MNYSARKNDILNPIIDKKDEFKDFYPSLTKAFVGLPRRSSAPHRQRNSFSAYREREGGGINESLGQGWTFTPLGGALMTS